MKVNKKRILAVLSALCLLVTGVCTALSVSAESFMNSGDPMESATITFVKTDNTGAAAETDFSQALQNYNEHDTKSNGKGTGSGYWILMDRYVGMTTWALHNQQIFSPTTSNNAVVVEWNPDTCRFEVTEKYLAGTLRQMLTIPRFGFVLYQYNTFGSAAKDKTFFTNLAIGTEVKVNLDEMIQEVINRQASKVFNYQTHEQLILHSTAAQIQQLKEGTRALSQIEEVTISSVDSYVNAHTDKTALTGSPISFHPDAYNNTIFDDQMGLYDAKVGNSVTFTTSVRAFYIPLAPVDGEPGVYQVQQYNMPGWSGSPAATPLDKDDIPQDGYLLIIRPYMSSYIKYYGSASNATEKKAAAMQYTDLKHYFAPGKKFKIENEAPTNAASTTTTTVVNNVRYDVTSLAYSNELKAEDVQLDNKFSVVRATGANQWTPAFNAETTTEAIVVDGVITAFGDAASGTYIPAGGYVISASGNKKAKLDACKVGDPISFKGVAKTTYNEGPVLFYGDTLTLSGTNVARPDDGCVLYNQGETTGTDATGFEVLVDKNGMVVGFGGNNNAIPEDGFVLSFGSKSAEAARNLDFAGLKVSVHATGSKAMLYRSPATLAEVGVVDADVYTQLLAEAGSKMEDLPYEDIEAAIAAAKTKAQAIGALLSPGADADKKAAFAESVGKAVEELKEALDAVSNLFVPIVTVENRAAWIVPAEKNKDEVRAVMQAVKAAKLNTVYVSVWKDGFTAYPSKNEEIKMLPALEGFDALAAYVEIGRELGLDVRAWMDTLRIADADLSLKLDDEAAYLANAHPEWLLLSRNGNDFANENGRAIYYLDPTNRDVVAFLSALYEEVVAYGVDGIVMDTLAFPENAAVGADGVVNDFGFNSGIMDAYAEAYGTLAFFIDDTHEEWQQWLDFKAACVNQLIYGLTTEAKTQNPALIIAAMVNADLKTMADTRAQDALDWAAKGFVDEIILLNAGNDAAALGQAYTDAKTAFGKTVWMTMGLTVDGVSATALADQVKALQSAGCTGVALYTFADLSDEAITELTKGAYRADTTAQPSHVDDALAAVLDKMEKTLRNVYAKYDAANETAYNELADEVKKLVDSLADATYNVEGLTALIAKVETLGAAVQASAADANAKEALKAELDKLLGWLNSASAQQKALTAIEVQELRAELDLGYDQEPVGGTDYPLVVTATVKKGDDTFTVRLTSDQYIFTKVAGDITLKDGVATVGEDAAIAFKVALSDEFVLSKADSLTAVEVSYRESGDEGDIDDGEEEDTDSPDTGVAAVWHWYLLVAAVAVIGMNTAVKRSKA